MNLRSIIITTLSLVLWTNAQMSWALPPEGEEWLRLETRNFTFFSNADEAVVRQVGGEMETLRSALSSWMGALEVRSPLPTWVYVFRDEESFLPYKAGVRGDRANIAGFFLPHPHGNYVAVNGRPRSSPSQVIYHEFLHSFISDNLPGVPLWFNEGLAELYSTFEVDGDEALVGAVKAQHLRWLKVRGIPSVEELFEVDHKSSSYNESARRGDFYAGSWAMVHYLMVGSPQRSGQLIDFLSSTEKEEDLETAFSEAFDATFEELEEELSRYLAQPEIPLLRVPVGELASNATGRLTTMDPSDIYFRLGDLLLHSAPGLPGASSEHFDLALRYAPDHGAAYGGLGQLKLQQGSYDEALAFFEKSLELAPQDFLVNYLLGRSLLVPWSERGVAELRQDQDFLPQLETALSAVRKSLELRPEFPEALVTLGAGWAYHPDPRGEGVEALLRARRRFPDRMDVAFNLAVLQARLGQRAEARRTIENVLEPNATSEAVTAAREAVLRADLKVANELLEKGQLEEGLALVETVANLTSDPVLGRRLQETLEKMREKSDS